MRRPAVLAAVVSCLATLHAGQAVAPPSPIPSSAEIDQIVTRVLESNVAYVQTFRNLVAEETKDILLRLRYAGLGIFQHLDDASHAGRNGESRFGILTPQRAVAELYDRTGGTKQKPLLTLAARLTFTYGAFRRFEVATEETIAQPR